jgi:hypothetical protein
VVLVVGTLVVMVLVVQPLQPSLYQQQAVAVAVSLVRLILLVQELTGVEVIMVMLAALEH